MKKPEIYISIDVETNGPAPGLNSMLALGAAAFTADGNMPTWYYHTLHPMFASHADPDTMKWWETQPEAWAEVNKGQLEPMDAMQRFVAWCDTLREDWKPVAVAAPAAFDFAFVNYYCHRFAYRNPLGFSCLDSRSYGNGLAGYPGYYGMRREEFRNLIGPVDKAGLRPHVALDDAIEQGREFMALLHLAQGRKAAAV